MISLRMQTTLPYRFRVALGLMAICFYAIHGFYLMISGETPHLLWACHIGSLAVGFGLIFALPILVTIGVLWLGFGDLMWFLYLAGGGGFEPTSPLTHIGGFAVGIYGLHKTGLPKSSWIWALIGLIVLQQITRLLTPEALNINLAFRVHEGWETVFPTYGFYLAVLLFLSGSIFFGFEALLNRMLPGQKQ